MQNDEHLRPRFPADHLEVYRDALRLQDLMSRKLPRMYRIKSELARQVDRAIDSLVLNIAEGATEFSIPEKRRFYRMGLRSGGEAAAGMAYFAPRVDLDAEFALLDVVFRKLTPLCRLNRRDPPSNPSS